MLSYTETAEIPGITYAGADTELIKYTPPADAEFLHYGYCKSIKKIPMTPDGKPTPALLTKTALELASIPNFVINAGSKIAPKLPHFNTDLKPGKNIAKSHAMDGDNFVQAMDYGRIVGRQLGTLTDCLLIGESIPGGTTTALAVLRGLGYEAKVSSSIPKNPVELKNQIVSEALRRLETKDPFNIVRSIGDPMIPFVAGMISTATELTDVILAGGTQMAAVLALGKHLKFNAARLAVGTTSYITNDDTANFVDVVKQISNIPIISVDPRLNTSEIDGLRAFSEGFAKEGVGAGGSILAAILKTDMTTSSFLNKVESEYKRLFATSQ